MTDSIVLACIDGSDSTGTVCDYATWTSVQLETPLVLLHVLDHGRFTTPRNLSGNIGLGSRENLLDELAELDEKRGKIMLDQGRLMLEAAAERVNKMEQPDLSSGSDTVASLILCVRWKASFNWWLLGGRAKRVIRRKATWVLTWKA